MLHFCVGYLVVVGLFCVVVAWPVRSLMLALFGLAFLAIAPFVVLALAR